MYIQSCIHIDVLVLHFIQRCPLFRSKEQRDSETGTFVIHLIVISSPHITSLPHIWYLVHYRIAIYYLCAYVIKSKTQRNTRKTHLMSADVICWFFKTKKQACVLNCVFEDKKLLDCLLCMFPKSSVWSDWTEVSSWGKVIKKNIMYIHGSWMINMMMCNFQSWFVCVSVKSREWGIFLNKKKLLITHDSQSYHQNSI